MKEVKFIKPVKQVKPLNMKPNKLVKTAVEVGVGLVVLGAVVKGIGVNK
jgi:hypothetical protein